MHSSESARRAGAARKPDRAAARRAGAARTPDRTAARRAGADLSFLPVKGGNKSVKYTSTNPYVQGARASVGTTGTQPVTKRNADNTRGSD